MDEKVLEFKNKIINIMDKIQEGEMTFSETGEYFYNYLGDKMIEVLEYLENNTTRDRKED